MAGRDGAGNSGAADALVIDESMPGLSGPELHLELLRRGRDVPVIFITAHLDAARFSQLMAQGAVACLSKPFRDTELLDALTAALARPRYLERAPASHDRRFTANR